MICFRDKTFCSFYKDCKGSGLCGRAFTPLVQQEAERWWGAEDPPICLFMEKPGCYDATVEIKSKDSMREGE